MAGEGVEIATAYVSIVPSMRGVTGKVAKEFEQLISPASDSGKSAGGAFSKAYQSAVKVATQAATATVTAGGVAMGVALTKGLGRLNAIDTAKAKLRGLGHDGESTAKIMENATAAVKGTAFGLDEAATTAAGAVAAGIQPGKELESTLKTVSNVAAATGRGMDDMGQIFNQVAAGGKAYTMQIKQIANSGLPIWQALATELGVAEDQVQSMASSGQIDFATFEKAASEAAGTVALEMGQTLPGSLDNLMAAVSRTGANMWKGLELDDGSYTGIYGKLADLVQSITSALGPVEDLASKVGDVVGQKLGPAIDWVTEKFNALGDAGESVGSRFAPLMNALGPAAAMFGALGVRGLAPLLKNLPVVGNLLGPLPGMLGKIGGPAGIAVAGLVALANVDPTEMARGFEQMAEQVPTMIEGLTDRVVQFATEVFPSFVGALVENLPVLLDGVLRTVDAVVVALVEALPVLIEGAITLFMGLVQALADIIPPLMESVVELVPTIIESLLSMLPVLIEGAVQLFTAIIEALPIIIPPLVDAVVDLIPVIVGALMSVLPELLDGAVVLFTSLIEALPIIIPELVQALIDLGPVMVDALLDLIPQLIQAGVDLLGGLAQGLVDGVGAALDAVKNVGGQIMDGIKGFFGINSPAKSWAEIGNFLDQGLGMGVTDGTQAVAAVETMAARVMAPVEALQSSFIALSGIVAAQVASIMGSLGNLISLMQGQFKRRVTGELNAVAKAFQTILPKAVQVAMAAMQRGMTQFSSWAGGAFRSLMVATLNAVAKAFQSMQVSVVLSMATTRTGMMSFEKWTGGAFKSSLVAAVNAIRAAFVAVPGAVSSSWGRLRSGTGAPANFVISSVYMKGIRTATNAITKAAGVSVSLPAVSGVSYAQGTASMMLPGYTPGRDVHSFYNPYLGWLNLSGGEAILRPEVAKAMGGEPAINALNARRGRGMEFNYASGGMLKFLNKGSSGWNVNTGGGFLEALYQDVKGGLKQLLPDPAREYAGRSGGGQYGQAWGNPFVKIADGLVNVLDKKMMVTTSSDGTPVYPGTAGGAFTPIGWAAMWRIIQNSPFAGQVQLTSAQRYGSGLSMHNRGRAIDLAPPSMALFNWLLKNFPNSYQILYSPAGARQIWWEGIQRDTSGFLKATHYDHVHWAMKDGGLIPDLFDEGGWLQPGLTLAENRSGKPEPVLTGNQWDRLNRPQRLYVESGEL